MKKLFILAVALAIVAFSASSSNAQGKIKFGVGADVSKVIASGFSDVFGIGIGGTAKGYYELTPMAALTATAGYLTYSGKDAGTVAGVTIKYGSLSQIPVLVGGRYYFGPAGPFRMYGGFDIGLLFSSFTQDIPAIVVAGFTVRAASSVSTSGSDFTYQPQIGFEAKNWDVAVRYAGVSGFGAIAARVGFMFN